VESTKWPLPSQVIETIKTRSEDNETLLPRLWFTLMRQPHPISCGNVNKSTYCSESQTIDDFGEALNLQRADIEHLRSVFLAVENGDLGMLKSLGIKV